MSSRYSKQREMIYNNILNRDDHPTAQMVYEDLKTDHPELSLGTVYRNLNFLANEKRINRLDLGNSTDHFDAITRPHHHFICEKCNQIYDVFLNNDEEIYKLDYNIPHQIKKIKMIMTGVCENCLVKEKEEEN